MYIVKETVLKQLTDSTWGWSEAVPTGIVEDTIPDAICAYASYLEDTVYEFAEAPDLRQITHNVQGPIYLIKDENGQTEYRMACLDEVPDAPILEQKASFRRGE